MIDLLAEFSATGVEYLLVDKPWRGAPIWVVGRAELVLLKRASGRPQDLVDVARLEELD